MRTRRLKWNAASFTGGKAQHRGITTQTERSPCSRLLTIAMGADISWNTVLLHLALCFIIWKLERNNNYTKLYELSPQHSNTYNAGLKQILYLPLGSGLGAGSAWVSHWSWQTQCSPPECAKQEGKSRVTVCKEYPRHCPKCLCWQEPKWHRSGSFLWTVLV